MDHCTTEGFHILINYASVKTDRSLPIRLFVVLASHPPSLHRFFLRLLFQRDLPNCRSGWNRRNRSVLCRWIVQWTFLRSMKVVACDERESPRNQNGNCYE